MKKINWIFCSLFFVASILVFGYGLFEFRNDYISIIGVGFVVLISGYLCLDSLRSEFIDKADINKTDVDNTMYKEFTEHFEKHLNELGDIHKAIYVAIKKNTSEMSNRIDNIQDDINKLIEHQDSLTNTVIKYNKENARQIVLNIRKDISSVKSEISKLDTLKEDENENLQVDSEIFAQLNNRIDAVKDVIEEQMSLLNEQVKKVSQSIENIEPKNYVNIEKQETSQVIQSLDEDDSHFEELLSDIDTDIEKNENLDLSVEEEEKKEDIDPNKPMSEADIAALIASMDNN